MSQTVDFVEDPPASAPPAIDFVEEPQAAGQVDFQPDPAPGGIGNALASAGKHVYESVARPLGWAVDVARGLEVDVAAGNILPEPGRLIPRLDNTAAAAMGQPLPDANKTPYTAMLSKGQVLTPIPTVTGAEVQSSIPGMPKPVAEVVAGLQQGVADLANFFTTDVGVATLGTAGAPLAVQRAVAAGFAVQMAKDYPQQFAQTVDAYRKGDLEGAVRNTVGTVATPLFVAGTAGHALGLKRPVPGMVAEDKADLAADIPAKVADEGILGEPAKPSEFAEGRPMAAQPSSDLMGALEKTETQGIDFKPEEASPAPVVVEPGLVKGSKADVWADQVIQDAQGRVSAGVDPELMSAYAVKGAALIEQGVSGAREWADRMVAEFGPEIKPFLASVRQTSDTGFQTALDSWVGRPLRDIGDAFPADSYKPDLADVKFPNAEIVRRSYETYQSWPETVTAADGTRVRMHVPENGLESARVRHLIFDNTSKVMDRTKAEWLPMVPQTLGNAAVRLVDPESGNRIYVRAYGDGSKHMVVVSPDGSVQGQVAFKGGLITQFPFPKPGRQSGMNVEWVRNGLRQPQGIPDPTPTGSTRPDTRQSEFQGQSTTSILAVNPIDQAKAELKQAWNDQQKLGIQPDPMAPYRVYTALGKLAVAYARQGVKTAADFAERLGVRLTKAVQQAWDDAVGGVTRKGPEDLPAGVLDDVASIGAAVRAFPDKVDVSGDLSQEIKTGITTRLYEPRSNETDAQTAERVIAERGIDTAIVGWKDKGSEMPGAVRTTLGLLLIKKLGDVERTARAAGNRMMADESVARAVDLIDHVTQRSTDLGQSLQAMSMWARLTPAGHLRNYQRIIRDAGDRVLATVKPALDTIKDRLRQVNQTAVDETVRDPRVQDTARQAIDGTVKDSADTKKTIKDEIVDRWSKSPDAAHRVAADHFQGRDAGTTLPEKIRKSTGVKESEAQRLAKTLTAEYLKETEATRARLASKIQRQRDHEQQLRQSQSVWTREKQSVSNRLVAAAKDRLASRSAPEAQPALQVFGSRLAARLRQQLLATMPERARGLAKLSDIELLREAATNAEKYQEAWSLAQQDLRFAFRDNPDALRTLDVSLGKVAPELFEEGVVDRVLRQQIKAARLNLGRVVRDHYSKVEATSRTLAAKLVADAGMAGEPAQRLASVFESRFKALATERKKAELAKLVLPARIKTGVRSPLHQKLIELSNLGAFSEEQFYNAVREKLGLPQYDKAVAAEIVRRANDLQRLPEGFRQQRAVIGLMDYISKQKGLRWWELAMPFWYSNALSGPTTHILNTVSNFYNTTANVGIEVGKAIARGDAGAIPRIVTSLAEGFQKGGLEAAAVLQTGILTGSRMDKLQGSRGLELKQFTGVAWPLNAWKYVTRSMSAADLLFFKPAEEMRMAMTARRLAIQEGLRGEQLTRKTADVMGNMDGQRAAAATRASAEGLTGLDYRRRVGEILEQGRPEAMREDARQYALRVTFNEDPYGVLGAIASGLNQISTQVPALRLVWPFTKIVANVTNESLNYFPPVGAFRAIWGQWKGELEGKPVTNPEVLYDQWAKVAISTIGITALAALAASQSDQENPRFAISGSGPGSPDQRRQLRATGWIPYTIKVGDRYLSYAQTPLAIPMAVLGNYLDALKYRKLDQRDALNRVAYALSYSGKVITEQSFLNGLAGIFDFIQRDSTKSPVDRGLQAAVRAGQTFVVPNLLSQIDRLFDPTLYDSKGVEAALTANMPFVRRLNKPALNVLGEPVLSPLLVRFAGKELADPIWRMIAEKQAWITMPARDQVIGTQSKGPDFYRMMTPDEFYEFIHDSGERIRDRLESRIDIIRDMEPDQAKREVQRISEEEHTRAKKLFRP
jgi:hypothetical protein